MPYDLLSGVRVVEASMYAFAPSAGAVLADWGADVIKVVPPGTLDPMNGNPIAGLPDREVGVAFMWEITNRGKRCVGVDQRTPDGQAVLATLVRSADVFITNLLPDARRRFRIDVDDLTAVRPGLVYARASGHGPRGPERDAGGFDHTDFWARTGMAQAASQVSDEFVPQPGPALGDLASGAFLAGGIAAALFRRERTGKGAVVDVSLLSSGLWMFSPGVVASQLYDIDAIPRNRHLALPNPFVAAYQTRDHRLVYLSGIQTEKHVVEFFQAVDRADVLTDPRFATAAARAANAPACIAVLDEIFAGQGLAYWAELLGRLATPWSLVQTAREAANDPQALANSFVTTVKKESGEYPLVASPAQFDDAPPALSPAPGHGEHTEDVLLEHGYTWDDILRLKESGAVL
ncbi:CoA transferase [Frankia sp. AgB1.9]|uniref:CaiB/BaiF CoA transferase family protein n=1 Tax=unclassified Frankia TaxID=2632575 RepID=UPI001931B641|nr:MULTISPECIES: CoA transferase [unclassified Frankia]MBL7489643.1 CoA transferase [Frankia sp. AgW1.1]MBL7548609.1 CoA transferase [Frankia sp. AgB1.9]MBL7621561.1 CoA transferase [Frankia sp. AgB1.8]